MKHCGTIKNVKAHRLIKISIQSYSINLGKRCIVDNTNDIFGDGIDAVLCASTLAQAGEERIRSEFFHTERAKVLVVLLECRRGCSAGKEPTAVRVALRGRQKKEAWQNTWTGARGIVVRVKHGEGSLLYLVEGLVADALADIVNAVVKDSGKWGGG